MKTTGEQRNTLAKFVNFATDPRPGKANFGGMLMISPDNGDVSFLAPVAPELRGVEIVSPIDDSFDVWRNGGLVASNLTAEQTLEWIQERSHHTEADYKKHIAKWTEDTIRHYKIPMKH